MPGILHHVRGRGIEQKEIFYSDMDRRDFLDRLAVLFEEGATVREFGYSVADIA